jgi:mRNA-degrading endonuclease RelE of RelBE toxin-antitoxin system
MREIKIEKSRKRTWLRLESSVQDRLEKHITDVAAEEKPTDHAKVELLDGIKKTIYRLRVGDYRVVFTTEHGQMLIWRLGARKHIYDGINETYEQVPA